MATSEQEVVEKIEPFISEKAWKLNTDQAHPKRKGQINYWQNHHQNLNQYLTYWPTIKRYTYRAFKKEESYKIEQKFNVAEVLSDKVKKVIKFLHMEKLAIVSWIRIKVLSIY